MQNVKAAISQIDRLLGPYPAPANVDARVRFAGYLTSIEDFDAVTVVTEAVTNFLKGRVAGYNEAFAATPGQLAKECRRIRDVQLATDLAERRALAQIADREELFHMDTPETRRMAVKDGLGRLEALNAPEQSPEQIAAKSAADAEYLARHDAAFIDMRPEAIARRLKL